MHVLHQDQWVAGQKSKTPDNFFESKPYVFESRTIKCLLLKVTVAEHLIAHFLEVTDKFKRSLPILQRSQEKLSDFGNELCAIRGLVEKATKPLKPRPER